LLHMGINTVDLKGEPFTLYVEEGQKVARGQLIALVDLAAIQSENGTTKRCLILLETPCQACVRLNKQGRK
uniref:PTS glucose transporter subunit IIA n=1 Tax=Enterococcus faecium TaxID=1352 RepID=UPI0037BFF391